MTAVLTTFALSALLCGCYLRLARTTQFFDIPNERSSHSLPTPHGGGVALLSAFMLGLLFAAWFYNTWDALLFTLAGAALILMLLGAADDLYSLPVGLRMAMYSLVCLWVANTLLQAGKIDSAISGTTLVLLTAVAMLWCVNLYNFMDGIDGLATLQTILACCFAAILSWTSEHNSSYALFCLLLAAAHGGFFIWNFPPARLFMGDAGSVPTGFLLAAMALLGTVQGQLNLTCWLVLLAVFITDASWTLMWRFFTGQAFAKPHRLHAYQRLSRYWGSHLRVDVLLLAINVLWLFPCAWLIQTWPSYSIIFVILAYLPLFYGMARISRVA